MSKKELPFKPFLPALPKTTDRLQNAYRRGVAIVNQLTICNWQYAIGALII
jgi:hypothetical protein